MVITRGHEELYGMVHDIKARNMRNMMLHLLSRGSMTKLDMMQQTGLSATTVSDLVNTLLRLNVVTVVGAQRSTGGRQPLMYHINDANGTFLGITLESTTLRWIICNLRGEGIAEGIAEHLPDEDPLHALYRVIDEAMSSVAKPAPLAVGLGVSGRVLVEDGIILEAPDLGWRNVPIKEVLERRYGVLTFVDNLVHQAALFQQVKGYAVSLESALCFFSRYPHRAALILDGRLCRGARDTCLTLDGGLQNTSEIEALMKMLGVTSVISDVPQLFGTIRVYEADTSGNYFQISSALSAQVQWFGQLYAVRSPVT